VIDRQSCPGPYVQAPTRRPREKTTPLPPPGNPNHPNPSTNHPGPGPSPAVYQFPPMPARSAPAVLRAPRQPAPGPRRCPARRSRVRSVSHTMPSLHRSGSGVSRASNRDRTPRGQVFPSSPARGAPIFSALRARGLGSPDGGAGRQCGKRASGRCPGVAYGQHAKRASHCGHNASKSLDFAFHGRHLWRRRHSWTAARSPRTHVCPNRGRFGLTLSKGQAYLGPLGSPAKASEFTRLHLQHLTSVTDEGLDRPIRSSGNPDPEPLGFSVRRRRDWMSRRNAVQPWAIWSQCSVYQQVPPQRGGKA